MKKFLLGFLALVLPMSAYAASPLGKWQTVDEDGQKKAVVVMSQDTNGLLRGTIIKLNQKPGAICDKCDGDKKGKPIEGMSIIWGLKADGENAWDDGAILDPASGSVYSLSAELIENGQKLKLRGYRGVSLLGRTQIWTRIAE